MSIDDPKLTAYALGEMDELTGEECRAVEALLAESAEARAFVEETAAFAQMLKGEFQAELPELQLGQSGRSDLLEEVKAAKRVVPFSSGRRVAWAVGVGAAAAAFATLFYLPLGETREETPEGRSNALGESVKVALGQNFVVRDEPVSMRESKVSVGSEKLDAATTDLLASLGDAVSPQESLAAAPAFDLRPSATPAPFSAPSIEPRSPSAPLALAAVSGQSALVEMRGAYKMAEAEKATDWSNPRRRAVASVSSGNIRSELAQRIAKEAVEWDERRVSNEAYSHHNENAFLSVSQQPLSTFSIDVDTASYSNVRRFLTAGQRPPADAVRVEELLNYFRYEYASPKGEVPFATHVEVAQCPWTPENRLVKIGLKGQEIAREGRAASNLVFLIDVSGSMSDENKLPLLKQSMRLLVERLGEDDRVAIVVYASEAGMKLPSTRGHRKAEILAALDGLSAGGSTNGGEGIQQAYAAATANFIPGGVNRVILATDGDFNVGTTSEAELTKLIEAKAKSGVYLTVLGFGKGNLKDATMKALSTRGNGNYAYIDSLREGRKVLVEQLTGTLVTIAKDVKIQVEFNPAQVSAYRLIGYENRLLRKEDFNDDKKDAGEIGAGHAVTALYEVVPAGKPGAVDGLKYQSAPAPTPTTAKADAISGELLTVKLRYKKPDEETSQPIDHPVIDRGLTIKESSRDFRFAAAVAEFGMLLKRSPHAGSASWASARELALDGLGEDEGGYRAEFIGLLEKAERLDGGRH